MSDETSLSDDRASLVEAQANRDPESVGPTLTHGAVRRTTSDELDLHRDWTVQSGKPFPQETGRTTRFHPSELPDPHKAVEAGLLPVFLPTGLVSEEHVTQTPFSDVALDHPLRERNRGDDPGYAASQATSVGARLEEAEAQGAGLDKSDESHEPAEE